MSDETTADEGWFAGLDRADVDGTREAVTSGRADAPSDWPALAVASGFSTDEADYYEALHEATVVAARAEAASVQQAPDRQLMHGVRAMDDCSRTANELAERLAEWEGGRFGLEASGIELARQVARREPSDATGERLVALAGRLVELADEREELRAYVEREAPRVAPNLSAIAGPELAARLIALAGGLKSLARKPSGTVQVLGAEDALFAHLGGRAPSPKHGVIYAHEYVRGTPADRRGSAARALAGKLSIAARVDHYSGERKPEIDAELSDRIETIRSRGA
jgi:nucleolar protein 56